MLRTLKLPKEVARSAKRLSSTQVVAQETSSDKVSTTKLSNGLTVVTDNSGSFNANISLLVKAGSRYEPSTSAGVSHTLRAAACLTSEKNSALMTTQLLGSFGSSLNVSATREHVAYNLTCGKKVWKNIFHEILVPTLFGGQFFWWEVNDVSKVMRYQVAQAQSDPGFKLMEAVHRASFSGELGSPVLCPESMIGAHSPEDLKDFFDSQYNLSNMVLAGTGVDHNELCDVASLMEGPRSGPSDPTPSKFIGSEVREHEMGGAAHAGLTFAGTSLNDQDTIALAVLQNILGSGRSIKRESGQVNRLISAVSKKSSEPFSIGCYNVNYSDAGLMGIYVQSGAESIGQVLSAVAEETKAIADGKLTDAEVNAGKQSLKADLLMSSESSQAVLEDIAVQTSVLGGSLSASEIASKVDAITTSQVSRVSKKVLSGKKSLAAVGDLSNCPYLSEL